MEAAYLVLLTGPVHGHGGELAHHTLEFGPADEDIPAQDRADRLVTDGVGHVVLAANLGAHTTIGRPSGGSIEQFEFRLELPLRHPPHSLIPASDWQLTSICVRTAFHTNSAAGNHL